MEYLMQQSVAANKFSQINIDSNKQQNQVNEPVLFENTQYQNVPQEEEFHYDVNSLNSNLQGTVVRESIPSFANLGEYTQTGQPMTKMNPIFKEVTQLKPDGETIRQQNPEDQQIGGSYFQQNTIQQNKFDALTKEANRFSQQHKDARVNDMLYQKPIDMDRVKNELPQDYFEMKTSTERTIRDNQRSQEYRYHDGKDAPHRINEIYYQKKQLQTDIHDQLDKRGQTIQVSNIALNQQKFDMSAQKIIQNRFNILPGNPSVFSTMDTKNNVVLQQLNNKNRLGKITLQTNGMYYGAQEDHNIPLNPYLKQFNQIEQTFDKDTGIYYQVGDQHQLNNNAQNNFASKATIPIIQKQGQIQQPRFALQQETTSWLNQFNPLRLFKNQSQGTRTFQTQNPHFGQQINDVRQSKPAIQNPQYQSSMARDYNQQEVVSQFGVFNPINPVQQQNIPGGQSFHQKQYQTQATPFVDQTSLNSRPTIQNNGQQSIVQTRQEDVQFNIAMTQQPQNQHGYDPLNFIINM